MWYSAKAFLINELEYLRLFRFIRIVNFTKLLLGYYLSRVVRKPLIWGVPFALSTEPSGHCQLKCPECPTGAGILSREKGNMTLSLFKTIMAQATPELMYLNLYFQGEPLLNNELPQMGQRARKLRVYTTVSTNGLLLGETVCSELVKARVNRVVISLDGITQPVYEKYRVGGRVSEVKAGIMRLLSARKRLDARLPIVVVQFLVFEHNRHELPEIKKWCRQNGVDKLEIKTAQINGFAGNSVQPPVDPGFSRYIESADGQPRFRRKPRNHCWRLWSSAVVAWNGMVAPCCYDKDLDYSPGTLREDNLKNVFKNQKMKDMRKKVLRERSDIEICQNCPEGRSFWS